MDYEQAINDPERPLSISPNEWMQRRGSKNARTLDELDIEIKTASIEGDTSGIEEIDMGIDSIVKGIEVIQNGLKKMSDVEMDASERQVLDKVADIVETALAPYTSDVIEEMDKLEGKE